MWRLHYPASLSLLHHYHRSRCIPASCQISLQRLPTTLQVERFMIQSVYPLYANVHTEVGAAATATGQRFEEARTAVAQSVGAPQDDYAVVFTGSGMTGAAFKLAHLLGISRQSATSESARCANDRTVLRPVVMYSIMEHHSNCLLWRELDCETVVRM